MRLAYWVKKSRGLRPVRRQPFGVRFIWKRIWRGAALLGWEGVGGDGVHFNVGGGERNVFVGGDLQELIAELDVVVQAEEGRKLVADLGVVRGSVAVEDAEQEVEVVWPPCCAGSSEKTSRTTSSERSKGVVAAGGDWAMELQAAGLPGQRDGKG